MVRRERQQMQCARDSHVPWLIPMFAILKRGEGPGKDEAILEICKPYDVIVFHYGRGGQSVREVLDSESSRKNDNELSLERSRIRSCTTTPKIAQNY